MKILRIIGGIAVFAALGFGAWAIFHHAAEDSQEEGDSEIATEVSVKAAQLVKTTLRKKVVAYGTAQPEPASANRPAALASVSPPSAALITSVNCVEGQIVKKGDVLVTLDARAETSLLDQAKSALDFATHEFDRQKELLKIDGTSEKNLQSAESKMETARLQVAAAETALALLRMEAPIGGVITKVNARQGEIADPSVPAVEILDPERVILLVRLPANEASSVETGQAVIFYRDGSELPAEGTVSYVSPQVDSATGTVEVRVSTPKENGTRAGEWLETRIVTSERTDVLAAPVESVTTPEEEGPVIAVIEGDTARQVPVKAGIRDRGLVEVQGEGLTSGTRVVTEGAYGLPRETKVIITGP